jgi:prepilin-type N-terminal cleavage/methylation domain-containing protein
MRRPHAPRRRTGFTLIELMVVVVVLALLIALLLPAINAAIRTSRDAAVASEINALSQALADFKNKYGEYPPSRIVLCENGNYNPANMSAALQPLVPRSVTAIRKYWPRVQIVTQGTGNAPGIDMKTNFYDFNGNNNADATPYVISGAECLVFFLGGIPQVTKTTTGTFTYSVTGFWRNPQNPFVSASWPPGQTPIASNRLAPLFEFRSSRLGDFDSPTTVNNQPFPGMPEYRDSLGGDDNDGIYYYFSAYGGVGYDPDDDLSNTNPYKEPDDAGTYATTGIMGAFMAPNAAAINTSGRTPPVTARPEFVASLAPNPYVNNDYGVPITSAGALDSANYKPRPWQNPQSFQIISPGGDRLYGIGGEYAPQVTNPLPFFPSVDSAVTGQTLDGAIRTRERDNLTNFAPGKLQ